MSLANRIRYFARRLPRGFYSCIVRLDNASYSVNEDAGGVTITASRAGWSWRLLTSPSWRFTRHDAGKTALIPIFRKHVTIEENVFPGWNWVNMDMPLHRL